MFGDGIGLYIVHAHRDYDPEGVAKPAIERLLQHFLPTHTVELRKHYYKSGVTLESYLNHKGMVADKPSQAIDKLRHLSRFVVAGGSYGSYHATFCNRLAKRKEKVKEIIFPLDAIYIHAIWEHDVTFGVSDLGRKLLPSPDSVFPNRYKMRPTIYESVREFEVAESQTSLNP